MWQSILRIGPHIFQQKRTNKNNKKMEIHRNETGWFWFFMLNFSIWKKKSREKCQNAEIHEFIETQMDFRLVK